MSDRDDLVKEVLSRADAQRPDPATLLAYQAVLAALGDGWNRKAAAELRDLTPENLDELHVICGDVQVMVEAERRRRGVPEHVLPDEVDEAVAGIADDETRASLTVALRRARGEGTG